MTCLNRSHLLCFQISKRKLNQCSFTRGTHGDRQPTLAKGDDTTLLLSFTPYTQQKNSPGYTVVLQISTKGFLWHHKQPDKQQSHHRRDQEKRLSEILPCQWEGGIGWDPPPMENISPHWALQGTVPLVPTQGGHRQCQAQHCCWVG